MHLCFPVILSCLDAGFEPQCGLKGFLTACCLLLLLAAAKTCCSALAPTRLELGPSWVVVLRSALEITVEERPLAFEMCLHGYDDGPETRLKNASFLPQNGPPRGTTAWYTPY